jgi:integrase
MNFPAPASAPSGRTVRTDPLRLAVAAYLARFKGASRDHTESDLRCYLAWCAEHGLDPLAARCRRRPHLELYIRWMQEIRRFKPSTVARRFSVVAGFYRTCVIDGLLEHSPAEHVRRPSVPPESPTLGFTHLQFEAMLTAARQSPRLCDFALVAMLGLLRPAHLRSDRSRHRRPRRRARPPGPARVRRRHQDRPGTTATCRRRPHRRADPAQQSRVRTSTVTRTTSWPPTWPPAPDRNSLPGQSRGDARHCR